MEEGHRGAALGVPRVESSNLRELLKVREDDPVRTLAGERRQAPPSFAAAAGMAVASRTLLDVIKDEDDPSRLAPGGGIRGVNWKAFKDRLKLRRATSAWSPSYPDEVAVGPGSPRPISIVHGTSALHLPTFASRVECKPQEPGAEGIEAAGQQEEPTGVSLMALLEQQERSGPSFAATVMGLVGDEDDDEDCGGDATAASEGKEMCVCCVCMVRHKGAAFIPCGHTFCRLCSRELWVSRGNCPLCNGYIQEILDIF